MSNIKPKETAAQRRRRIQTDRFLETYAVCGDIKQAARLSGLGIDMAHRAFSDPDSVSKLQKHLEKVNPGDYLVFSPEQRKSFLTKCFIGGIMPRVIFDVETDEPTPTIIYEPISQHQRFKCLDMLNKMDGVYVEKREIVDKRKGEKMTADMREKLDEIYGDSGQMVAVDEEDDILAI